MDFVIIFIIIIINHLFSYFSLYNWTFLRLQKYFSFSSFELKYLIVCGALLFHPITITMFMYPPLKC
jgi:hypothetical protein